MFSIHVSVLTATLLVSALAPQETQRPVYHLDLRLDPDAGVIDARMRLELPAEQSVIRLDLTDGDRVMRIANATSGGRSIRVPTPDPDGVVELPLAGTELTLQYTARMDSSRLQPFGYYLLAPLGSNEWVYPEIARTGADAMYDFRVRLEYPERLAVYTTAGTGQRLESRRGRVTAEYQVDRVKGFAIVAGEGFRVERHDAGGAPVVAFYHPDYEERFRFVVDRTVEAARWYNETYGFFPLDEVGVIQGHPRWGGGYPLPNMFAIHLGNLSDEQLAWITAHELGHYYWGFTVLSGGGDLEWLNLAMGIWADQLYLSERAGIPLDAQFRRDRGQGGSIMDYFHALAGGWDQRLVFPDGEVPDFDFDHNSLIRHGKAATGIYLQSLILGPDQFLDLQRRILDEYAGRPLELDDLVTLLEANGSPDARAFFDAWVQDNATLDVVVGSVDSDDDGWIVEIERTGTVPYPVPVEVRTSDGGTRHVIGARTTSDTIRTAGRPLEVLIDPDGRLPIRAGSHPEMRVTAAAGLERARRDRLFILEARAILDQHPDETYLRYRLVRRLHFLGRFAESADAWPADRSQCTDRDDCLAALYAALSLEALDRDTEAGALMDRIRDGAEAHGLASSWSSIRDRLSGD